MPRRDSPRRATAHAWEALPQTAKRSTVRQPCSRPVCRHCGLVAFNNAATQAAVRAPCPGLLDEEETQS